MNHEKKISLKVDKKITEQVIVEDVLNKAASGYDNRLALLIYSMVKKWHYKKLLYYLNLFEEAINSHKSYTSKYNKNNKTKKNKPGKIK